MVLQHKSPTVARAAKIVDSGQIKLKSSTVARTAKVFDSNHIKLNQRVGPKRSESLTDEDCIHSVLCKFRAAVGLVKRQHSAVDRRTGLSGAQLRALNCIDASPGMTVSELARELGIHPSTASNMLDGLEREGHLGRRRVATDQRIVSLYLSDQGRSTLRSLPEPQRGVLQRALIKLPSHTLKALDRTLGELLSQMNASESGGERAK